MGQPPGGVGLDLARGPAFTKLRAGADLEGDPPVNIPRSFGLPAANFRSVRKADLRRFLDIASPANGRIGGLQPQKKLVNDCFRPMERKFDHRPAPLQSLGCFDVETYSLVFLLR